MLMARTSFVQWNLEKQCTSIFSANPHHEVQDARRTSQQSLGLRQCHTCFTVLGLQQAGMVSHMQKNPQHKNVVELNQPDIVVRHWQIMVNKHSFKQDCIPVGCIPPACWPYLPAYTAQGGCLLLGVFPLWGQCLFGGGVVCSWGVGVVSQHALRQTPLHPMPLWTESQTVIKT